MRGVLPAVIGALTIGLAAAAAAQAPRPEEMQGQPWLVPLPGQSMMMRATVYRPAGAGPFPLAVINHGSSQSSLRRAKFAMPEYRVLTQWFLARGYAVVLPLRPGHGETGGPYFEDQGRCEAPDYQASGLATADLIQAAVDDLSSQPFIRPAGTVVLGHSAGGWGAVALAARAAKVSAIVNVAGGRGGRVDNKPNTICAPERLVAAAATFGRRAHVRSLWLYADNDSYFPPAWSKRMYDAFRDAGAPAVYHLLPGFAAEGHNFIEAADALPLWAPIVEEFLARDP